MNHRLTEFLEFSVEVTCFTRFELLGTGQAEAYLQAARKVVDRALDELLDAYQNITRMTEKHSTQRDTALRREIFGNQKLGPIARAITKLWYIGIWYELPRNWTEAYGALPNDGTFVVSASAYAEGLLWTAIGAHPPGAKAQGYGSWEHAPVIPSFKGGAAAAALAPAAMQTEPGHVAPQHATKPQHPPPPAEGAS